MPQLQNMDAIKLFTSAFSVTSFGCILYHTLTPGSSVFMKKNGKTGNTRQILLHRLVGVFIFGLVPLFIIRFLLPVNISYFGTGLPGRNTFFWFLAFAAVIIPMNYFNSKNPQNLIQYPQIRIPDWSFSLLLVSAISWVAYLFAYEFMFRGFFLFSSLGLLGLWPAIIINTAVYSLVHIPKGKKETIAAIPFGILLSYLTIKTGTFWLAFFVHCVLALSNEWFSLAFHPEMHLKKSGT